MDFRLTPDEVHLWVATTDSWADPAAESEALAVLGPEERTRWERRRLPEERRLFAVSHWLVRQTLSRYGGRPPEAWRFTVNDHGKPRIDPALAHPELTFSLAHTRGLAVCAVAWGHELGVDVERTDRVADAPKLVNRFFAATEARSLKMLSRKTLQERFFLYWTLKEATLKALGTGLSLPLDRIAFAFTLGHPAQARLQESLWEDEVWHWAALALTPPYVAALALRDTLERPVALRTYQALPATRVEPLDGLALVLTGVVYRGITGKGSECQKGSD
ncbi:MAG: 4'-phosphopantetheinyl transferase superfamily protein [Syntrophaceae bacterium]|nr:4'-phosphopantetheinyl transferase superfamily protein [Syntrophaceae bacterium]